MVAAQLDERGVELRDVEAVHIAAFIEWMGTRGAKSFDKAYEAPRLGWRDASRP